jgi:SM-20-related protein
VDDAFKGLTDGEIEALGSGGLVVQDGFLGGALAAAVRAEALRWVAEQKLRPAAVSRGAERQVQTTIRADAMTWIEPQAEGPFAAAWERFDRLREALNEAAYLGLRRFDLQLAHYPPSGAFYARHWDAFRGDDNRRLTAIVYLNPGWNVADGGLLRAFVPSGPVEVAPELDRLVLFLSERVEHEVLPTSAPRLALTAWYSR